MKPTIEQAGPRVDEVSLLELKAALGERLPSAYREFLLAFSGYVCSRTG